VLAPVLTVRVVTVSVCVCLPHAGLYRNSCIYGANFWHTGFRRLFLHCVLMKLAYLSQERCPNSGLGKFGHGTSTVAECDKQFHGRRLLLTTPGDDGGGQVLIIVDRRRSAVDHTQLSALCRPTYSLMGDWRDAGRRAGCRR